jgi:hypothetical protein
MEIAAPGGVQSESETRTRRVVASLPVLSSRQNEKRSGPLGMRLRIASASMSNSA